MFVSLVRRLVGAMVLSKWHCSRCKGLEYGFFIRRAYRVLPIHSASCTPGDCRLRLSVY